MLRPYVRQLPKAILVGLLVGIFAIVLDLLGFNLTGLEPWHVGGAAGLLAAVVGLRAIAKDKKGASQS